MRSFSYGLFLLTLVFCPLAFGTVENWSRYSMVLFVCLSFLFLSLHVFLTKKDFFQIPGVIPLLLLLSWMILQLIPLPAPLVRAVSPSTFEIYRPLLELNPSQKWISLSVYPKATLYMFFTFGSYALFYFLAVYHLSTAARLKQTIFIVAVLGSIIGVQAILQKLTSPEHIYWFRATPSGSPAGPWVYRNHFAGFMEMVFPLVVALFLVFRPRISGIQGLREKFIAVFTQPGANKYLLLGTAAILMAVSILFSLSRGGIITLSIAFVFFVIFSVKTTRDKRTKWVVFLTISTVLMISWLGWQPIMERFGSLWDDNGLNTGGRFPVYLDSVRIIRAHPFFGTGFGTFIDTYPAVRTVAGETLFDHAHNDYIELLTDGGILGFFLAGWFVLSIFFYAIRKMSRRREKFSILITSGALTGMLALLFHSLVDFQMYNGANGLYFFFLCGLAVSGANTRFHFRTRPTLLHSGTRSAFITFSVLALILLVIATIYNFRQYKAFRITTPMSSIFLNHNIPSPRLQEIQALYSHAAHLDPLEAGYRSRLGHISLFLANEKEAQEELFRACLLRPLSGLLVQQLGLSLNAGQSDLTETLLSTGIQREPHVLDRTLTYADWLIAEKRRTDALQILDTAFRKNPARAPDIARYLISKQFTKNEIVAVVSPDPVIFYALGRITERKNQLEEAEFYYLKTIEHIDKREKLPAYFSSLYNLYQRQREKNKAVAILRQAIDQFPEYASFRVLLGDHYMREGVRLRAVEEYRQALNLDPASGAARQRLERIQSQ